MNLKKKRKIKPKNSPFTRNTQRDTIHTTVGVTRGLMTEQILADTIFNSHKDQMTEHGLAGTISNSHRDQMTENGMAGTISNSHGDLNLDNMVTPTTTHTKGSHTCRDTPQSNTKQNDHTINLVLETYNCHGFKQNAEYVLERILNCDIMGLSETWLHSNEVHSIKTAMQNHPKFKDIHNNFEIFSKPGMVDVESDHLGRPKGGVSLIVKNNQFSCREIEVLTDRVIAIGLYDKNNSLIQVICSTYMPFYNGKREQTDLFY